MIPFAEEEKTMSDHHHNNGGRIFWGLALVVIGALFLLDRLGMHDFGYSISRYWPVIIMLVGLSILISSGFRRPLAGVILIGIGVVFQLRELDILEYDVWHYIWPAVIILIGLSLLIRPRLRHWNGQAPAISQADLDVAGVFYGMKRRIEAANFRGGRATAVFGGVDLDFTAAGLEGGKATLEATAIFGGIEIIVPRDWRVVVDGTPILGGIDEKQAAFAGEPKGTLFVKATAIFGSVTIKN
jgi:predicted membrane protein